VTSPYNISVKVDVSNPGEFFACCGLLEIADRCWRGAEGWFDIGALRSDFRIAASDGASLCRLLGTVKSLRFDLVVGARDEAEDEDKRPVKPIQIESPVRMVLDWWSEKSIKPWAGSMKERLILNAMLRAIDHSNLDPLNYVKDVSDPPQVPAPGRKTKRPEKREPFYFDQRRGCNSHPLDSGFSPDAHDLRTECYPAVEALCFIGLQRARPAATGVPNRSQYVVWTTPLPVSAVAPVVCGLAPLPGSLSFTFVNFFRTDQRKHKSYSRATREKEQRCLIPDSTSFSDF
jgi:hypothetical protein